MNANKILKTPSVRMVKGTHPSRRMFPVNLRILFVTVSPALGHKEFKFLRKCANISLLLPILLFSRLLLCAFKPELLPMQTNTDLPDYQDAL